MMSTATITTCIGHIHFNPPRPDDGLWPPYGGSTGGSGAAEDSPTLSPSGLGNNSPRWGKLVGTGVKGDLYLEMQPLHKMMKT